MNLVLARVFVATYKTRRVTLAGVHLELTQPTASNALARLRTSYGGTRGAVEGTAQDHRAALPGGR
ncbi:hypothetical protein DBA29_27780 [Xenophilus aerolatus]|nr:hypothetical protein [Xenophilus aerolatus]